MEIKFAPVRDAAESRGYKPRQLREFIKSGLISAYQLNNGKLIVDLEELHALIRSKRYTPTGIKVINGSQP